MIKKKQSRSLAVLSGAILLIACIFSFGVVQMVHPVASASFAVPCTINTYGSAWDGNLTFGLFEYNPENASQIIHSYLVVMKTDGELLNLREYSDGGMDYWITKYINSNTAVFQGEPGTTTHFWNLNTNQTTDFSNINDYHHDIDYDPVTGDFLVLKDYVRNVNGTNVLYDMIAELNEMGSVLWTWDTYNYFPLSWADPYTDTTTYKGETVMDFTHCNAIQWDYEENIVYLNVRHLDTFFKINMTTGNVIWGCGLHGNFTLVNASGKTVSSLWYHSHATEEIASDVFIMFDNDYHNQTDINDAHSRILEITLNEQNMTARESWSWEAPEEYWSQYWGKADVLPNGDRIGTFGTQVKQYDSSIGAVVVEVNPQGQVMRTWTFPRGWGIYRVVEGGQAPTSLGTYPDLEPVAIAVTIVAVVVLASILLVRTRRSSRRQASKPGHNIREAKNTHAFLE
jgi:hypothetical protein